MLRRPIETAAFTRTLKVDECIAINMLVVRSRELAPSIWHKGVSMLLRLMRALSVSLLFSAAQGEAQIPTEHPELIAGPWEVASTSGIKGIFFEIVTSSSGPTGREQFDWQTMNIRVYHREGGKEAWGYFGTKDKASPQSYNMQDDHSFTLFDGEHLRIHSIEVTDLKSFDLDITFSPTSHE